MMKRQGQNCRSSLSPMYLWSILLSRDRDKNDKGHADQDRTSGICAESRKKEIGIFSIFIDFFSISDFFTVCFLTFQSSLDSELPHSEPLQLGLKCVVDLGKFPLI